MGDYLNNYTCELKAPKCSLSHQLHKDSKSLSFRWWSICPNVDENYSFVGGVLSTKGVNGKFTWPPKLTLRSFFHLFFGILSLLEIPISQLDFIIQISPSLLKQNLSRNLYWSWNSKTDWLMDCDGFFTKFFCFTPKMRYGDPSYFFSIFKRIYSNVFKEISCSNCPSSNIAMGSF